MIRKMVFTIFCGLLVTPLFVYPGDRTGEVIEYIDEQKGANRFWIAGIDDVTEIKSFFYEVKRVIEADDVETLADMILFPMVKSSMPNKPIVIQNKDEFVSRYTEIVSMKMKSVIADVNFEDVSVDYNGVQLARGVVQLSLFLITGEDKVERKRFYIYSLGEPIDSWNNWGQRVSSEPQK